ncbi:hypothetical protein BC351_15830 [Paenibacillus ferrarius]|uniref:Uncharacterized protein n=1 Tax=Paenibacillus ferrarius TaxID=1469647 RepID=A0A1V4HRR5_9BACL|nr:hypothetical protein BC351_15830 [Paenibacillus ferrarius]
MGLLTSIGNIFFTHYLNSLFLNAVGTKGTAVIVYAEETNSLYNEGEVFAAKYVPGFERNILIMRDMSVYGQRWLFNKDLKPVNKVEAQLAARPANPKFITEYRLVLQAFIEKHREGLDPALMRQYEQKLEALEARERERRH